MKILDIGCGQAKVWQLFPKTDVIGLDISKKNLSTAKKYIKPIYGNATKLPFKNNFFDFILASEVLEHIYETNLVLKEINRVLKKKGKLVVTFPNTSSIQFRLSLCLWGRNPTLNYPHNVNHIRFFNIEDIKLMLKTTNLKVKKIRGCNFLSFHKVNFKFYIPIPRYIRYFGGDLFPSLSLGCIMMLEKQ